MIQIHQKSPNSQIAQLTLYKNLLQSLKMTTFQNIQSVSLEDWPCPRWGHSMISIQNQIFLFGGYQNSKYYNDLWRFDIHSLAFRKIEQFGELPPPCSNFTLNYYEHGNVLLLFGGGTLNKEKLNAVYQLNMSTFTWSKMTFDQSDPLPWQRSYHCSEIIGHYLIIYGGQFFHDLDDTWLLDLNTHRWRELKLQNNAVKPTSRKFASSFVFNNRLYIIGGCSGKYDCLEDSYCLDFSEFLATNDMKLLHWKQVQLQSRELIVRWGHISVAKGNKAYVFGGRQNNKDLQDLIEIDLLNNKCKRIEIKGQNPKGRRKPGVCIRNNTLFCFSGFDGSYVKDFIYFNLPINLDTVQIHQDKEGKQKLVEILTPDNVEEEHVNFQEEVLYVTEEQYEEVEEELASDKKEESYYFQTVGYRITKNKLTSKSAFFQHFLTHPNPEAFSLHRPQTCTTFDLQILLKMFLTYIQFGKVIVQRSQFANSRKYFKHLLSTSQYYCCPQLMEICKKELLRFFTDQIIPQKVNIEAMLQMGQVMAQINIQYESYAAYYMLNKLIERHRASLTSLLEFKQCIVMNKEYKNKEWLLRMIEQYNFQLAQVIIKRKDMDFQNINSLNIPHKEEILYEKTRKGSMHSRHTNL